MKASMLRSLSLLATLAFAAASQAVVLGGRVFVKNTGNVTLTYLGSTAGYMNILNLTSPNSVGPIFNNYDNDFGDTFDLGTFAAGTELVFNLHVDDTGDDFYTGQLAADGLYHNLATDTGGNVVQVDFEDGGDREFNDLSFNVSNATTTAPAVPGPVAALPFALMAIKRRKRA